MENVEKIYKIVYDENSLSPKIFLNEGKMVNLSLILEKYIPTEAILKKGNEKRKFLNSIRKTLDSKKISEIEPFSFLSSKLKFSFSGYVPLIDQTPFTTSSRLIIGLGGTSPLETSITLHHTFGIPYIPGTALKGVCRMVAFWKVFYSFVEKSLKPRIQDEEKLKKEAKNYLSDFQKKFYGEISLKEEIKISHQNEKNKEISLPEDIKNRFLKYQLLFGAQNFKGLLLFLDSYPDFENIKNNNIFDLDITNVHYPDYYRGGEVAGDWESPNPIFFLTISSGVPFSITVLFDQYRFEKLKEDKEFEKVISAIDFLTEELKKDIQRIIKEALEEFGIGAKTRVGYGLLKKNG